MRVAGSYSMKAPVALSVALALGGASCAGDQPARMTPAAGRVPHITAVEAADSIAHMRCDLEQRCERIGPLERFGSFTQCIERMHLEVAEGFGRACDDGTTRDKLHSCLGEIAASDCGQEKSESYAACEPLKLCR
jgi:hypothetical protein